MTPGAPSPGGYNPHTPGSNIEQGGSDWVTTDILVRVKDSFVDLMGQRGVIRSVTVRSILLVGVLEAPEVDENIEASKKRKNALALRSTSRRPLGSGTKEGGVVTDLSSRLSQGGMCSVFMQESEKVVSVSSDHLEPVTPTKNDKVKPGKSNEDSLTLHFTGR